MAASTTYSSAPDAKHLFDMIGKDVYEKAKNDANDFREKLKGTLSDATYPGDKDSSGTTPSDPCQLLYQYHTNVTSTEIDPCNKRSRERFSDTKGAECDYRKIRDSDKKSNYGACAPFRRLSVCDTNLEQIDPDKIESTHNLLVDVCQAAKHEGASITGEYPKYQNKYDDSGSTMCTMLARSFADIGDIIRGKDLYLGNKGEKKKREDLENKLKKIFGIIYDNLVKKNVEEAQERYKKDEDDGPNYYQLREDWWALNRQDVWKAMTCSEHLKNSSYFHATCNGGERTKGYCRCDDKPKAGNGDQVPTYFDYVPQYLRWFEEWAEDFCRKRKHKLENAIKKCRGDNGKERYCDLNGYNCEKTARGAEIFVKGDDCHKCSVPCDRFVHWIDNQKLEFEKQRNKYAEEIKKAYGTNRTSITTGNGKINNLYVKDFYERLKTHYGSVNQFLQKLNDESICKKPPTVVNETASRVDFNNDVNTTFYRTKYCEACPWCGVNGTKGNWTPKKEPCGSTKTKTCTEENSTDIKILSTDKGRSKILEKLKTFCRGNEEINYDIWKCHYDDNDTDVKTDDSDNCILGNWKNVTKEAKIMSYNAFFWKWVHDMLIDSIEWRTQLGKCINNNTNGKTCITGCNKNCDCYKRWVEKKKDEWSQIKKHFDKQKDIPYECYFTTLEGVLNKEVLLTSLREAYGNANEIKRIEELLEKEEADGVVGAHAAFDDLCTKVGDKDNTTIDKLLDHEDKDAKQCIEKHKCQETQKPQPGGPGGGADPSQTSPAGPGTSRDTPRNGTTAGRSETGSRGTTPHVPPEDDDDDDDEEEEEEDEDTTEEVEDGAAASESEPAKDNTVDGKGPPQETQPAATKTQNDVKVCETVKSALTGDNLTDACKQKYQYGKEKFPNWKCISDKAATGGGGEKSGDKGSICVPPRRRKLYVGKLEEWATTSVEPQAGGDSSLASTTATASSPSPKGDSLLLTAFVESAAIETFFLWHRYKEEKKREKKEKEKKEIDGIYKIPGQEDTSTDEEFQNQLKSGKIPTDFLRLMFYTLGDYRDILFSGDKDNKNGGNNIILNASGNKEDMEKIQKKIKEILNKQSGNNKGTSVSQQQPSGQQRENLWSKYAEPIWNGMIYALTYNTDTASGENPTQNNTVKTELYDTNTAKEGGKYNYKTAKLEDESGSKNTKAPGTSDTPTLLTDFISRPPYFRYLEEWGENFCKERKKRLEKIYKDCKVDESGSGRGAKKENPKCSCYGEHCQDNLNKDPTNVSDLDCPSCGRECRKYKKWIEKKKTEYEKQKNAYGDQKAKCQTQSNGDQSNMAGNGVCGTLEATYTEAKDFLKTLGPCSKTYNDNGEGKKFFENEGEAFRPATNCAPCSQFRVKSEKCNCGSSAKGNTCQTKNSITANDIGNGGNSAEDVSMHVSDNDTNTFEGDALEACNGAGIFTGIKENKYKCGNVCGYVVCKPINVNGEKGNENEIIIIRALVKRWLEYFFKDYNKIRKKLKSCMNSSDATPCIKGCAEEWLKTKKDEWEKIKKHYLEQYKDQDQEDYNVKTVLEKFEHRPEFNKAIKPCPTLEAFLKSSHCNGSAKPEKKEGNAKKKDGVVCLLENLKKEIEQCNSMENSGDNQASDKTQTTCDVSTPLVEDDDEEDLLLEEENTVEAPNICPEPEKPPKEQTDGNCEEAASPGTVPEQAAKENVGPPAAETKDTKKERPPKPAPIPRPPPRRPRAKDLLDHPAVIPSLVTSTLAWSVGIGFATFTYFYLK
ncbi:hypothetical protein PFMALIP_05794, partial [Plasmodium falciparum MaliPS096_E11]